MALKLTALTIDQVALLLTQAGGTPVDSATIESYISEGLPTNADGTIDLVMLGAWLARERGQHGR